MNHKISHLKGLQRTTPDGRVHKHPHNVLEHCVCLLPFLVVHHHLTKVVLIGIIIGILKNKVGSMKHNGVTGLGRLNVFPFYHPWWFIITSLK